MQLKRSWLPQDAFRNICLRVLLPYRPQQGLSRKLLEGSRRDRDNDELNGMHLQPDLA